MANTRVVHTATLLPSGQVLVAGGEGDEGFPIASAELYDPATGMWTRTAHMHYARDFHTATLLRNGRVLVSAGYGGGTNYRASAELYGSAPELLDIQ